MKDEEITIGKIVNAVALRGEVRVYPYTEPKERFEALTQVLVVKKGERRPMDIQSVRYQKNMVILKLKGVEDRTAAEALRDSDVRILAGSLPPLPEDTFYIRDLIGCQVYDAGGGEAPIGVLTGVLQNTAQDIYVVRRPDGREALIPAVGDFIQEVDTGKKQVLVRLIPGLIEE